MELESKLANLEFELKAFTVEFLITVKLLHPRVVDITGPMEVPRIPGVFELHLDLKVPRGFGVTRVSGVLPITEVLKL